MLIIRALAGSGAELENLSGSDDTNLLLKALRSDSETKDVGHAGTAMRFLTAYYATRREETILTGSGRMKQRPIGPLVKALKKLGAEISYMEEEGCPPLKISGGVTKGGKLTVEGGISSQFISALMMIGPVLEGGLHLTLSGEVVSESYIEMTLALMRQCGIGASFDGRSVTIPEGSYHVERFAVESDWSAASYWFQVAVLSEDAEIRLPCLRRGSLQGDAVQVDFFGPLGVESLFTKEGLTIRSVKKEKKDNRIGTFSFDFTKCPDLVQTCAATLSALGMPFHFTGTQTLRVKETDRISALQAELGKLGYMIRAGEKGRWISWDGKRVPTKEIPVIETYQDHRMAMAFAPLAIHTGSIVIQDPLVVTKSYPGYWSDLQKAGFGVASG